MERKTKVIATIGPASSNEKVMESFDKAGVSCIRINTAHGTFEEYEEIIKLVRKNTDIPILIDVKGPEIRVRTQDLDIKKNSVIDFGFSGEPCFSYDFYDEIDGDEKIFFDNGLIEGKIVSKNSDRTISIKFFEDALLKPNKGVNIPNKSLNIPILSSRDKKAIDFAKKHELEFIALSFVRRKEDLEVMKKYLGESDIGIISKIENKEGIDNVDDIISESDGIMIARGDLGVEVPEEKIPVFQKNIIRKCNQEGKIAIVATQMLESMISNKIPTRAETSDVANAILDGADCCMLSGETAVGKYPVRSVQVINKISREVENIVENRVDMNRRGTVSEEMSKAAYTILKYNSPKKLVTLTKSGFSASLISRFRVNKHIIAVTDVKLTSRKMNLMWGVKPVYIKNLPRTVIITKTAQVLLKKGLIDRDEFVIFFAGVKTLQEKISNLVEVHYIDDLIEYTDKKLTGIGGDHK